MENHQLNLPLLNDREQRVLGALIEKSKATPEYYPMTVNGLLAACNQKTSRKPVVQYDEQTVVLTLDTLKKKGLVATVTGGTSRSVKYKHNLALNFQLGPAEMAIICLLLLRGPQTPGELNTNSGRLYEFDSLEEVQAMLEGLSDGTSPFVAQLARQPGQKETRYKHLLGDGTELPAEEGYAEQGTGASLSSTTDLASRLSRVEEQLEALQAAFERWQQEER